LLEYTPDEMKTIIMTKGVEAMEADAMIVAYEKNRMFAISNKLSPVPNFRNLITVADEHLRSLIKAPPEPEEPRKQSALTQSLQKIDTTLQELKSKIGTVNQHKFSDALDIAVNLLTTLTEARDSFAEAINQPGEINGSEICKTFNSACKSAINVAKPVLERDLGWGDYLVNLLKALVNAVVWIVSCRTVNAFFSYANSISLNAVEQAERDLDLQEANNGESIHETFS
jgi:hypothetical protein